VVHVYFDYRPVCADAPVAARWVSRQLDRAAYGFQVHHTDPLRIVRGMKLTAQYGQLETLALGTIPVALAACLLPRSLRLLALSVHAFNALASSAQVIHAYTHLPASQVPRAVRWAQDHGLVLSRAVHARHHHATTDRDFAVVTGWCNPLVDAVLAWGRPHLAVSALA
jgi:ubiquitin-conjugating enzyme E2 variant